MNAFGISDQTYQLIRQTFISIPAIEKVILFGSRAKGNYKDGSDIDLAIVGKNCTPGLAMQINAKLNEELPIPYFVDVIDYLSLKHPDLKEHIDRVGIEFYKR
ncbi:MAG: nucleotidyltransferase domain-containing protein [Sediminibacterium sp.]